MPPKCKPPTVKGKVSKGSIGADGLAIIASASLPMTKQVGTPNTL